MVIDSSALLAILLDEPEADRFEIAVEADPTRLVSVASVLETSIVAETRYGEAGSRELDLLIHKAGLDMIPVDAGQLEWARYAWHVYGKGHHPAKLNFGDCFAYALSRTSGEPLLYKGNDFAQTDVVSAASLPGGN